MQENGQKHQIRARSKGWAPKIESEEQSAPVGANTGSDCKSIGRTEDALRILLIEDSERLRKYVGKGLRQAGFSVDSASDGEEGLWLAESNLYDVIVLDLMRPKLDGLSILKQLKSGTCQSQVLILSAKDTVSDRVRGLKLGADDYLVKPFALDELVARVFCLVRRHYRMKSPTITISDLEIDMARRRVTRNGRSIELPPREYALLEYLLFRRGEVVSRSEIEEHIYDERAEPCSNVVDAAVYSLRKRIDPPGGRSLIQTRRGLGYIIDS